jgi:hypothetical protein
MAANADTVVLAVGTDLTWAKEARDAKNISFTDAQLELIYKVSDVSKNPVVLVLFTATPLDLSPILANPKVGAILHVGQPAVAVLGVRDLLYGHRSPAGRTIQTVYPSSYQDEVSIFDFNMRPGPSTFARPDCTKKPSDCPRGFNPGRTHRFYTGVPVLPFGYGLSYSTFSYLLARAPTSISLAALRNHLAAGATPAAAHFVPSIASSDPAWRAAAAYVVNVTNTGTVDADDSVLGFFTPPDAGMNGVPLQTLFGFERVHVLAGQTVQVWLYPSLVDFAMVGLDGRLMPHEGAYVAHFGVEKTAAHGMGFVKAPPLLAA